MWQFLGKSDAETHLDSEFKEALGAYFEWDVDGASGSKTDGYMCAIVCH